MKNENKDILDQLIESLDKRINEAEKQEKEKSTQKLYYETKEQTDKMSIVFKATLDSLKEQGFTEDQAFDLLKNIIAKQIVEQIVENL